MSEWKIAAAQRRDARQAKDPVVEVRKNKRRDTKRWCRGKMGVEHTPECRDYIATKRTRWLKGCKLLVCTTCGKELETWRPSAFNRKAKPDWVIP